MTFSNDIERIITAFCKEKSAVYRTMYFYGTNEAIANTAERLIEVYSSAHPSASIYCVSGTSFVQAFFKSVRYGYESIVASLMCKYDLLLIKNIEEIAGKKATMQQLYYVLDKRLLIRSPFVVFGNTPPNGINGLAPRIQAILDGSLVWEIN